MVRLVSAAALLMLASVATEASGQASRLGPTFNIGAATAPVVAPDVAYDPTLNRYLKVAGKVWIEGHLLDGAGTVLASVRVNPSGNYAQMPRVIFAQGINGGNGGYLVTWHESIGTFAQVRGRMISTGGVAIGSDFEISPLGSSWIIGATAAYSTASQEFLVAWMGDYPGTNDIMFQRIDVTGGKLGATVRLTSAPHWERDPSIAYNPHTNQFYLAYAGFNASYSFIRGQIVQAGTGQLVGATREYATTLSTLMTSVTYNPNRQQYLLAWYHESAGAKAVYGQVISGADGSPIGGLKVLSAYYAAYDALDVEYNTLAGQYLLVTHGNSVEDAAVTILDDGNPYDNGFSVTQSPVAGITLPPDGNFHPRVAASTTEKKWLVVAAYNFATTVGQLVSSNSSGGGGNPGPPPPAPPPPAPTSNPRMNIDAPSNQATLAGFVTVSGWAVDLGAPTGDGVHAVHVWAWPTSGGAAIFMGSAPDVSRPDVGAAFGDQRFSTGGFQITSQLPAGSYYVVAYALSTVAGTFNNERAIQVTVTPPLSIPRMALDMPVLGQNVTTGFRVSGWALDLGAGAGTGVDAVHVWAWPVNGGSGVPLGSAQLNQTRPDVGAAFGNATYAAAGFNLDAQNVPRGEYYLVVYARSNVAGTFNNQVLTRIHVR